MKKCITTIILWAFVFTCTPIPASFADDGTDTATETKTTPTPSSEAASAASAASAAGINNTLIEGGIFASVVAIMAVAIASGSDFEPTQPTQGHGH